MNLKERTRIIGELQEGVKVIFDSEDKTPYCDLATKKIHIPYVDDLSLTKERIAKIRGYIDHEKMHIKYTTPGIVFSNEMVAEIVNWLEDIRIYYLPMYKGERQNLKKLEDISYEYYRNSIGLFDKDSATLMDALFSYQGYEEMVEHNEEVCKIVKEALDVSKSTEDLIPYAESLSKILTLPESESKKDFFDDEDNMESALNALYKDRGSIRNKIEDLKKVRSKETEVFEYGGEYRPYTKEDSYGTLYKTKAETYKKLKSDVSRVSNKLKTVIKQKLLGLEMVGVRDRQRNGLVDLKRLSRAFSDVRVFRKPDEIITNNVCVGIILDCSGSMNPHILTAVQTLIVISESLYEIKIPFSIITHSTTDLKDLSIMENKQYNRVMPVKISVVKDFSEDFNKVKYRIGAIQTRGFTIENEALRFMIRNIQFRKEPKKYIFVISDGNPEDIKEENDEILMNDLKNCVYLCKKNKITLINFCLEYTPAFKFPKIVRVNHDNLLGTFVKEFRKVLKVG